MKIEGSLYHFQSSNTQEKRLDIAVSRWKEHTYMLACERKLLLHYKSIKSNKKTIPMFFLLPNLCLSTAKAVYHYKIICNDAWGLNFEKKKN